MRIFVLYLLLFATMLPTVTPFGIIAHYQLNKEYIARVLCQNRNRPELHCDGKCFLARRLKAQQDKQDKETTERVHSTSYVQLFCEVAKPFEFSPLRSKCTRTGVPPYCFPVYTSPLLELLQPPQV